MEPNLQEWGAADQVREIMNNMDRLKARHLARIRECRSCHAPVIWFPTKNGGRMPVDAATVKASDKTLNLKYHVSHFATCPDADKHRRKKK